MLQGLGDGNARALHQTRVASRRLREILPVLQVGSEGAKRLGRRLRKVTAQLGAVRELDVLCLLVDELAASGRYDQQALRRVSGAMNGERKRAHERLLAKLPMGELRRIAGKLEKIEAELKDRKPSREWRWAVEARVTRRALALKAALIDAGALYLPERLHVVRIALKKLRYAQEVWLEASGLNRKNELRALKRSQDILGRLHDVQVLVDRIRQMQSDLAPSDAGLLRKLDGLIAALENECRHLHARFMHQRSVVADVSDRAAALKTSAAPLRRVAS